MKLSTLVLGSSALFGVTTAPPPPHSHPSSIPTIWLCGDSTAAPGGGHNGTEGWGQFLQYSFDATIARVNNSAYAGRSARSFTREGRFQRIADVAQRGDWVIIEFGHNDGGNPYTDLKGRADCPGTGE
jgi:rhamnogalacturonan acetylesterase